MSDFEVAVTPNPPVQVTVSQPASLAVSSEDSEVEVSVESVASVNFGATLVPPVEVDIVPLAGTLEGYVRRYEHTQNSPASTWTITHNLGAVPSVTLVDGTNTEMEATVTHPDVNTTIATFSQAESGKGYLKS